MNNALNPTSPASKYWSVELVRGIAAIMVVIAHYAPHLGYKNHLINFTTTGVDLFFVITGFVFAPQILKSMPPIGEYAARRFFRIYPLYVTAIIFYISIRLFYGHDIKYIASHLTFTHTLQSREIAFFYNPAFWSLPPEVEFYLLLPLLHHYLSSAKRRFIVVFTSALVLHLSLSGFYQANGDATAILVASFHLPGLLIEFLLGTLVWKMLQQDQPSGCKRGAIGGIGVCLWIGAAFLFREAQRDPTNYHDFVHNNIALLASTSYACILYFIIGMESKGGILIIPISALVGNISYAVYLMHNGILTVALQTLKGENLHVVIATAVAALLAVSVLIHFMIEAPFRRFGRSLGVRYRRWQQQKGQA